MVRTHGLTHVSLAVADPERSLRFYERVFGVREHSRDEKGILAVGPGPHDAIGFERRTQRVGLRGGIDHFGFKLVEAADIDAAVSEAVAAGGALERRGEFAPGCPYAYLTDPDGYRIEVWFGP